ncbi:di-copper centre-containing protein [Apiospora arundinis]
MLLIETFTRVIHQIDTVEHITALFNGLEAGSLSPSELSPRDRRSVLDFPEEDELEANLRQSTMLPSRAALLERAVHSPADLTAPEMDLLGGFYWLGARRPSFGSRYGYYAKVRELGLSDADEQAMHDRLSAVRAPLFAPDEWAAIEGACKENGRRWQAERDAQRKAEIDKDLARLDPRVPWIRQIWEDTEALGRDARWGFVHYRDPCGLPDGANGEAQWEDYECRKDARMMYARAAAGIPDWLENLRGHQRLSWPEDIEPSNSYDVEEEGEEEESEEEEEDENEEVDAEEEEDIEFSSSEDDEAEDEEEKEEKGEGTSYLYATAPPPPPTADGRPGGLQKGLLTNVFLVYDRDTIHSVLDSTKGLADEMWVWAVDPDYQPSTTTSPSPSSLLNHEWDDDYPTEEYRGYFKVRLQQLVKNFYLARRYRTDEFSMADLWGIAQKSRNQTFVSLDEAEFQLFSVDRFTGSALRSPDTTSA